jgi:hypothetical protein
MKNRYSQPNHRQINLKLSGHNSAEKNINISPFVEQNGQLTYRPECKYPDFFAQSTFEIDLFGDRVVVDHFVLMFPDQTSLTTYGNALVDRGAKITEGPGKWPDDFCAEAEPFPPELAMYFLSAVFPSGGIIVLLAPNSPADQNQQFLKERGVNGVPHIAIRVNDMDRAVEKWRNKGFIPLSSHPQNDGSLCQWFVRNWAGQIIELIERRNNGQETFSCENIRGLRLSEVQT